MKTLTKLLPILLLAFTVAACGGEATDEPAEQPDSMEMPGHAETTAGQDTADAVQPEMENGVQVVHITAGANGYDPGTVELRAGVPARLVFTRTTDSACLEQVQIPDFDVEKTDLPMNEPVEVTFTPEEDGQFSFVCGMDMQHGTIVVKA